MDNLTHSLCGWTLARAGLNRYGKWVTPLVILLANLPDLETVLLPGNNRATYLLYHRGITHSVLMLSIYSLIFGALLWFLERRSDDQRKPGYLIAVAICAAGLFSHIALDFLNNYGVRPGIPFDSTWFYGDMIFIMDPWVWLMFGIPDILGSELNRFSMTGWSAITVATTVLACIGIRAKLMPWQVLLVWFGFIALAILFRKRFRPQPERCARTGLVILSLYLVMAFTGSRTALARAKADAERFFHNGTDVIKTSVQPFPAQPWRYDVFLQTNETLSHVSVNLFDSDTVDPNTAKLNLRDPALDTIRSTFEYRAWMGFARHPYALRRGNVLILGDMRFKSANGDWTSQTIELP